MKSRPNLKEAARLASELDDLNARLNEMRAESRRLSESRAATDHKIEALGHRLSDLQTALNKATQKSGRGAK